MKKLSSQKKLSKQEQEALSIDIFNYLCPGWIGTHMIFERRVKLSLKDMLKPIKEAVRKAK